MDCGIQPHELEGHYFLECLNIEKSMFVNDMTKYKMLLRFILSILKYRNRYNLLCVTQVYKAQNTCWSSLSGFYT